MTAGMRSCELKRPLCTATDLSGYQAPSKRSCTIARVAATAAAWSLLPATERTRPVRLTRPRRARRVRSDTVGPTFGGLPVDTVGVGFEVVPVGVVTEP